MPPWWRAKSQLNSAVRTPPTWRNPVGAGANRTRPAAARSRGAGRALVGPRRRRPHRGRRPRRPRPRGLLGRARHRLAARSARCSGSSAIGSRSRPAAHRVDDGAPHRRSRARPRGRRPAASSRTSAGASPAVAEQLHGEVDVVDRRGPPERRRPLHRELGHHRDRVVDATRAARASSGPAPGSRASARSRRSGRASRASAPFGCIAPRSPGRSARHEPDGGMCDAGREVRLLARLFVEGDGDERVGRHGRLLPAV